ncbi:MAG: enoyl-CoA hydratase [Betaproteobacteria bacterium]|nr:enoyl-CoA hydratase [Betaproteobacteria bacterium]
MTLPAFSTLRIEQDGQVLVVTINRPEVMNAINTQMCHDFVELWTAMTASPGEVRCMVLTGAGERAFCAGGDLKERNGMSDEAYRRQHDVIERANFALTDCPVPVIAAANGHAFGGGLEILLACDFAYGVRGARFALTEVKLGIMPGSGGTQNLPRAVGERRAKELILTGRPFSAEEALEWGVLNRLCEPEQLMPAAIETARAIAANAPLSVRQAKKSIHFGMQSDLRTGYRFEIEAYDRLIKTEDRLEGARAFNEKRTPQFRGR